MICRKSKTMYTREAWELAIDNNIVGVCFSCIVKNTFYKIKILLKNIYLFTYNLS